MRPRLLDARLLESRIMEAITQSNIGRTCELLEELWQFTDTEDLRVYLFNWVINYGEARHVDLLCYFAYDLHIFKLTSEYAARFIATVEPTERSQAIYERILIYFGNNRIGQLAFMRDVLTVPCRNDEYIYRWVCHHFVTKDRQPNRHRDVLKALALAGDSRLMQLCEAFMSEGHADTYCYIRTMELFGAVCLLSKGDLPALLRIYSRVVDTKPAASEVTSDILGLSYREALKHSSPSIRILEAFSVIRVLFLLHRLDMSQGYFTELVQATVNTSISVEKSAKMRMVILTEIVKYDATHGFNCEQVITRFARATLKDCELNGCIDDLSLGDIVRNLYALSFYVSGPNYINTVEDMLVAKIDLIKFAEEGITITDPKVIIELLLVFSRRANATLKNLIHTLISQGEHLGVMLCTADQRSVLSRKRQHPMVEFFFNTQCWCLHPFSDVDRVPKLRSLAVAPLASGNLLVPKGFNDAHFWVANGAVSVPLRRFVEAHEELNVKRRQYNELF